MDVMFVQLFLLIVIENVVRDDDGIQTVGAGQVAADHQFLSAIHIATGSILLVDSACDFPSCFSTIALCHFIHESGFLGALCSSFAVCC